MRLPPPLIKDILLQADFSVEELLGIRQDNSFFADMLSDNSFWVSHSPHGLAARNAPKTLLPALERRRAAYHAFREQVYGQQGHSGTSEVASEDIGEDFSEGGSEDTGEGLSEDGVTVSDSRLDYVSFDAMLAAARRPFNFLSDLADRVWGGALYGWAPYRLSYGLMRDMTFASTAVNNVNPWFLHCVMHEAQSRLKCRQYRRLCEAAVARDPWLILHQRFTTHRGAPAHQDRALVEQALSQDPRIFAYLPPSLRRQTKLIKTLEAKVGLDAKCLNDGDQDDPVYVRRLFDAQLFKDDPYFLGCLIRTQVAPPAYLYGRLDEYQLVDAMKQNLYCTDRVLIREAVCKNGVFGLKRGVNFALYPNDGIGPQQMLNVTFLNLLVTEPEFSGIVGQDLYDTYARPYGLKTAALEENYVEWRANMAQLALAAILALYLDPYAHALVWPQLWGKLLVCHFSSMWSLSDLWKPPWQRPTQRTSAGR